jgi:hypothetical protein
MKDPCQRVMSLLRPLAPLVSGLMLIGALTLAAPAPGEGAGDSFDAPMPSERLAKTSPALRTANLSPAQCRAELGRRKIAVKGAGRPAPGVATPVRLAGTLSGVRFSTPSGKSPYGILDCRLVLALEAFARVLARHDVVEARIDNLYRPRARLPGRKKPSQHSYGLAADIMGFTLKDGRKLVVERDFGGALGTPPCGPESRVEPPTEAGLLLRNLVCAVAREGLFHYMLTPNYNTAHRDHLHFDIKRGLNEWTIE